MVWNVATRTELAAVPAHEGSVRAVAFSPDGKIFASAGRDGQAMLWDTQTMDLRAILQGHRGYIYSLAFCARRQNPGKLMHRFHRKALERGRIACASGRSGAARKVTGSCIPPSVSAWFVAAVSLAMRHS